MKRVADLLRDAAARLTESSSARLDAEMLLSHVLAKPRSFLFTWPEHVPDAGQQANFEELLKRRADGEPVAFLLGQREFFGRCFRVTHDTLIPRPDTELLVEVVLDRLPAEAPLRVLDLGTGSGAIALSLALERPAWQVVAADVSEHALRVAKTNARELGVSNASFLVSDWFERVDGMFDAIVSNPPYIARDDVHLSRGDLRFEPRSALVSGPDGLDDIRVITARAPGFLRAGGTLAFEHGHDQGAAVADLMTRGGFDAVETLPDMAGHPRVTVGVSPSE